MKQLRTQRHSQHNPKAWASLDCLLTSLPIMPLLHSSAMMRSNGTLPLTDTRRISPQTTSSSGYHSDLSSATSANESPQSISEIQPISLEKTSSSSNSSTSHYAQQKTIFITTTSTLTKSSQHKSLSRLSSFIRKQYERAKSKFIAKTISSSQPSTATITTCTKGTSTTPLSHLSDDNYILLTKQQQQQQQPSLSQAQQQNLPSHSLCNQKSHYHQYYLSSVYKQNSSTQPVYSVYIRPLNKQTTTQQSPNYVSIHECYSHHQPSYRYSAIKNTHQYPLPPPSSSTRRLATMANFEHHNTNIRRHNYYPVEHVVSASSYPYRYSNNNNNNNHHHHQLKKNYELNRSNYVPLSDFFSTQDSAFKPIKPKQFYQRPVSNNLYEQIPPSNDPCDLEVAQYFPQTSHWSNPNYFDIYSKEFTNPKQTYTETLC